MVDIETLLAENKKLSEEVSLLRAENAALKKRLGLITPQEQHIATEEGKYPLPGL